MKIIYKLTTKTYLYNSIWMFIYNLHELYVIVLQRMLYDLTLNM